jgi:hypothetical protein
MKESFDMKYSSKCANRVPLGSVSHPTPAHLPYTRSLDLEKQLLRKVGEAVTRFKMIREGDRVLFLGDTPYKVAINEAVDLAKRFSTGDSGAFVNGILDRLRIDLDAWLSLMRSGGHFGLGSFGALASRAREALRRGRLDYARQICEDVLRHVATTFVHQTKR